MTDVLQLASPAPELTANNPTRTAPVLDAEINSAVTDQVHAGQTVVCRDGPAGHIVATMRSPAGRLQQIAVRPRWWWRKVIVPAALIQTVDHMCVRLTVARRELKDLPEYRNDGNVAVAARDALRDDRKFRDMMAGNITVTVRNGVVMLSGHVTTSTDKVHAGQAVREVRGAHTIQNELVIDDELVHLVAQAVADDERTPRGTILVSLRHGVVTLNGRGNSAQARLAAEESAAQVPMVRGVSNYIEVQGVQVSAVEQQVMQPWIGQEVFASDMALGHVEKLIVDPHNRRVAAIVIRGRFPGRKSPLPRLRALNMAPLQERHVVIPLAAVAYMTTTLVQLDIDGIAAAGYDDFSVDDFVLPDPAWRPPYPYHISQCLWTLTPATEADTCSREAGR